MGRVIGASNKLVATRSGNEVLGMLDLLLERQPWIAESCQPGFGGRGLDPVRFEFQPRDAAQDSSDRVGPQPGQAAGYLRTLVRPRGMFDRDSGV